jgi:hypothetical protein
MTHLPRILFYFDLQIDFILNGTDLLSQLTALSCEISKPALSLLHDNHACWRRREKMSQPLTPHGEEPRKRRLEPCGPACAAHPSRRGEGAAPQDEVFRSPSRPLFATSGRNTTSPKSLTRRRARPRPFS